MRTIVCIKEYQRKEMLENILKDIPFPYLIYDDCSDYKHDFRNYLRVPVNFGREAHWGLWAMNLFHIQFLDFDNVIFIPSDFQDVNWDEIQNICERNQNKLFAYNIVNDGRKKCWTNFAPKINKTNTEVGFVDCGFFTNKKTLDKLGYFVLPVDQSKRMVSSGVGQQLSKRMLAASIRMYVPNKSLAYHGDHDSTMHLEHRKKVPLISKNEFELDKPIYIGIATFKGREKALKQCLKSLQNQTMQATQIFIYDNEKSQDITDLGKFEPLRRISENGYYLSCDDDLIYPPDYIERTVKAIHEHKCIVTYHGRQLLGMSRNYFTGHKGFRCLGLVDQNEVIDVAGTGVTGFDTSYFNPDEIYLSENMRMADCVFSLEAALQNKTILLLAHKRDWIRQIPVNLSTSCYMMEKKNPAKQIEICNEIWNLKK